MPHSYITGYRNCRRAERDESSLSAPLGWSPLACKLNAFLGGWSSQWFYTCYFQQLGFCLNLFYKIMQHAEGSHNDILIIYYTKGNYIRVESLPSDDCVENANCVHPWWPGKGREKVRSEKREAAVMRCYATLPFHDDHKRKSRF